MTGKSVFSQIFSGNSVEISPIDLASGLYFYEIKEGLELIGSGKVLTK